MAGWLRQVSWSLMAFVFTVPALQGQALLEERPQFKQLSRAEIEWREADERFREAQALFGMGVMRHRGDRWLEAVTLLEEAAALDPQTPAAYRALVPLYLSLAREEDALVACQRVLQVAPTDSETSYQASKLYRSDGRMREAIAVLALGATGKSAAERPDLLYFMLSDLSELQKKAGDFTAAASSYRRLAAHLLAHRARLIGSDTLSVDAHAVAAARAYEQSGQCLLQLKQYDQAIMAFRESRDFLAAHADRAVQAKAVRLNWNLALACISQQKWAEAWQHLRDYLESRPSDPEPYEKLVMLLKKMDRAAEAAPAARALRGPGAQFPGRSAACARELGATPNSKGEAERRYLDLAERFVVADVYRDLFKFYQSGGRMGDVLRLIDNAFTTLNSKDDIPAETREQARDRARAMLTVLRGEPAVVNALLPVIMRELRDPKKISRQTLQLCAALAARARQLDKAEDIFREILVRAPLEREAAVYGGLLEVLWLRHKPDAVIALCREALDRPDKAQGTNLELFHRNLALALSEKDRHDEALAEIDKAIKLAGDAVRVTERCTRAQILAHAERYDTAFTECETLLKELNQANEIKQVRFALATICTLKGDHDKSDAHLQKVLEEDPNDALANNNLGYQWADRNSHLDEAEKMIRRATELDKLQRREDPEAEDNAAYLDSLGWALFRKGKLVEARGWLEKAVALPRGADDPTVWDHLGDVLFKLEQTSKARDAWRTAIKLYDHDKRSLKEGRQDEAKRKLKMVGE